MPDLVIKPEDLEEMPKKTRELLLEYVLPRMGLYQSQRGDGRFEINVPPVDKQYLPDLTDQPPTYIPIEAAIAVLLPLKEQSLRAVSILTTERPVPIDGFTRSELAELLEISEKSVNGVVGGINRRYSFRLDKTKYDRTKCRVIHFNRKTGCYTFLNESIKLAFTYALQALEKVEKDGLSYEQYDFNTVSFPLQRWTIGDELQGFLGHDVSKGKPTVSLNQYAIDEFLREDNEAHNFDYVDEHGDSVTTTSTQIKGHLLVGEQLSHFAYSPPISGELFVFDCFLSRGGRGSLKYKETTSWHESEELPAVSQAPDVKK
jgi:hypothetical protein